MRVESYGATRPQQGRSQNDAFLIKTAYLINRDGQCRIVTDGASKHRLGSRQAQPFPTGG